MTEVYMRLYDVKQLIKKKSQIKLVLWGTLKYLIFATKSIFCSMSAHISSRAQRFSLV